MAYIRNLSKPFPIQYIISMLFTGLLYVKLDLGRNDCLRSGV